RDRRLAPGRGGRRAGEVQLHLDADRALARALRVDRGRAYRPVVRADPGHLQCRDRPGRGESGPVRRDRSPARVGDPARRRQRAASPLVTAYSDPALPGFGHYKYDHEGTPGRRVVHIDKGIFRGFMNSRQTAAIFGGEPNGHWKATDASLVPLIRMSNTVFDA